MATRKKPRARKKVHSMKYNFTTKEQVLTLFHIGTFDEALQLGYEWDRGEIRAAIPGYTDFVFGKPITDANGIPLPKNDGSEKISRYAGLVDALPFPLAQREEAVVTAVYLIMDDDLNAYDFAKNYTLYQEIAKTRYQQRLLEKVVRALHPKEFETNGQAEIPLSWISLLDQL